MAFNKDRRLAYLIIALVATLLFMVAIGYNGWQCGDSILGPKCIRYKAYQTTGALLLTAGLFVFVGAIFILLAMLKDFEWAGFVALASTFIAAILALAAMFYYFDIFKVWSPFIGTIAMSLTIALAGMLIFDLIHQTKRST
ncbi:unnamed protein product [Hymenolepis diminuta]|uniref:Expressed conserved protein n=1 Tax=Hymenolepis diminuta TaxID=6216 RepID=A0A0R3SGG3_HYMDI|nr:unnamed protein product [Hymenolepis diminuta]VUZ46368.1 unnamed protein product [Hymenolepis diminuta]